MTIIRCFIKKTPDNPFVSLKEYKRKKIKVKTIKISLIAFTFHIIIINPKDIYLYILFNVGFVPNFPSLLIYHLNRHLIAINFY